MNWVSLKSNDLKSHISESILEDGVLQKFTTLCGKEGYSSPGREVMEWEGDNPLWMDGDCQECKRMYLLIKNL